MPLEEDAPRALHTQKEGFISPPVISVSNKIKNYTSGTHGCFKQVRRVLLQNKNEGESARSIGSWSLILIEKKENLDITNSRCLAVVWALLLLHPYLKEEWFMLRTDHHSLWRLLNLAEATGKLTCLRLQLIEFDLKVAHGTGINLSAADVLSRLPTNA